MDSAQLQCRFMRLSVLCIKDVFTMTLAILQRTDLDVSPFAGSRMLL
jgi:hypothetical protein